MAEFKLGNIPQDLLIIQELIGPLEQPPVKAVAKEPCSSSQSDDEDISSSSSESEIDDRGNDSEDEVAANLVIPVNDSGSSSPKSVLEPSESSSEDSDSDSESEAPKLPLDRNLDDLDDDEDPAGTAAVGAFLATKHEVVDADITIPEIDEVAPEEQLKKVGEVLSIVDQIAIVRGVFSEQLNNAAQTALDSETLLVFDDRKVMGYIYETFGPTTQPLYQVKFNDKYPLRSERVQVGREIFCVPSRSNFVFVERIKAIKGSDASNVYDEEPADDELEFSDDEAEAAFKNRLKRKRAESRQKSVVPSQEPTPNPSHLRDQQLVEGTMLGQSAYSENGPYDPDYSEPGPSRPRPSAYDDPYANPYDADALVGETAPHRPPLFNPSIPTGERRPEHRPQYNRGRGRGRGRGQQPHRGRGGMNWPEQARRGSYNTAGQYQYQQPWAQQRQGYVEGMHQEYDPLASLPIALAPTMPGQTVHRGENMQGMDGGWGYSPAMPQNYNFNPAAFQQQGMGMMPFVQPHINPRFAPAFGFQQANPNSQQQQYPPGVSASQNAHQQWPTQ